MKREEILEYDKNLIDLVIDNPEPSRVGLLCMTPEEISVYLNIKGLDLDTDTLETNGWDVDYWVRDSSGKFMLSGSMWHGSTIFERLKEIEIINK